MLTCGIRIGSLEKREISTRKANDNESSFRRANEEQNSDPVEYINYMYAKVVLGREKDV